MSEKPEMPEYSEPLEHAERARQEVTDVEGMMEEARRHIKELEKIKDEAVRNNEFARKHGLREDDITITQIEKSIRDSEQLLKELEEIKNRFSEFAGQAEQADAKIGELLKKYHFGKEN